MAAKQELAAWIGLDWAEDRHEIRLRSGEGSEVESFQVCLLYTSPSPRDS